MKILLVNELQNENNGNQFSPHESLKMRLEEYKQLINENKDSTAHSNLVIKDLQAKI